MVTPHGRYRLKKNLPGRRNAAAQWFGGFRKAAKEHGLIMNQMRPTLMKKENNQKGERLMRTIHMDDIRLVGDPSEVDSFP